MLDGLLVQFHNFLLKILYFLSISYCVGHAAMTLWVFMHDCLRVMSYSLGIYQNLPLSQMGFNKLPLLATKDLIVDMTILFSKSVHLVS